MSYIISWKGQKVLRDGPKTLLVLIFFVNNIKDFKYRQPFPLITVSMQKSFSLI